jgi:hypothetical protein
VDEPTARRIAGLSRHHAGDLVPWHCAGHHAEQQEGPGMIRMFKWLLCEIFGYAGDHAWVSVWMDDIVMLADGTTSAGYLMMRTHKGACEFRHMTAQEELEAMRLDESL